MAAVAATGTAVKELRSQTGQESIFHAAIVIGAGAAGKMGVVLPVGNGQISSFVKALSRKPNAVPESRT
ncbi:MAG: hypothetical protein EOR55_15600 [Mesorhizobium sp.]|nr:MAG: hypothetical protein EOR55_15600 [Mesorhizobium sp.]